jgi:hypothetical protein
MLGIMLIDLDFIDFLTARFEGIWKQSGVAHKGQP